MKFTIRGWAKTFRGAKMEARRGSETVSFSERDASDSSRTSAAAEAQVVFIRCDGYMLWISMDEEALRLHLRGIQALVKIIDDRREGKL